MMTLLVSLVASSAAALTPTDLRCEYLTNPLGIEETHPRLTWIDTSTANGAHQTAYRIVVSSTPNLFAAGQGNVWDTGKVNSDQTAQIVYAGNAVQSRETFYWKVQVWDGSGRMRESKGPATWEMGLLHRPDWKAQWIGMPPHGDVRQTVRGASWIWYSEADAKGEMPKGSCYLQKEFEIDPARTVESAMLAI